MRPYLLTAALLLGAADGAGAQAVTWGAIGGAAGLRGDASMQAASALFEFKPVSWLTFSANPTVDRVSVPSTTGGPGSSVSSTGPTDLPLGVSASHEIPNTPLSPTLGAGISPTDNLSLDLNLWHPFAGDGVNGAIDAPRATSVDLAAGYDWTERVNTSIGYSTDVGPADSGAVLPQAVAAGFVWAFAKPLALTVNGARGLTSGAPRWLVSVGIGTAFSGINPVGPNSLFGRLKHALGNGANRGKGKGKVGK